jgi:hypothetical protein
MSSGHEEYSIAIGDIHGCSLASRPYWTLSHRGVNEDEHHAAG